MKQNFISVAGLCLVTLLVNGCDETPSTSPVTTPSVTPAATRSEPAPVKGVWPFSKEGEQTLVSSSEMLQHNYYVVLDGSGSMSAVACSGKKTKIDAAKEALRVFAGSVPADANLGMTAFDQSGVKEHVPLGAANRDRFTQQVDALNANGGTPLKSSIRLGYDMLTVQARKQLGYGEYHLVVVTDGEASKGEDPSAVVNQLLSESPVVLHTIGFCISKRHSLNQPGRILYRAANDIQSLNQGLQGVLAESPSFAVADFQ